MKKFYTIIIFFLFTFNSNAHVGHYNNFKKIELEILRNNEVIIPRSSYVFKKNDIIVFIAKKDQIPLVENIFRISAV